MPLTDPQRATLLKAINPNRVKKDPRGFSHVEAFDVIAHLTRVFGFEGWDKDVKSLSCIFDDHVEWTTRGGEKKQGWDVAYACVVRLIVKTVDGRELTHSEDAATGSATHQPTHADAHDLAIKDAVSSALKRCAKDLGDQFGLSLYADGMTDAFVNKVIPYEQTPPGRIREENGL